MQPISPAAVPELIVDQSNTAAALTLSSNITGAIGLTKTGAGLNVTLSGIKHAHRGDDGCQRNPRHHLQTLPCMTGSGGISVLQRHVTAKQLHEQLRFQPVFPPESSAYCQSDQSLAGNITTTSG